MLWNYSHPKLLMSRPWRTLAGFIIFLMTSATLWATPLTAQAASGPSTANFTVSSTAGWQQTPIQLTAGDTYVVSYVSGSWTVDYRNFPRVGPAGYTNQVDSTIYQGCKYYPSRNYAVLLGAVGASSNPAFPISTGGTFTAGTSGPVFLRINDDDACLGDNAGSVTMKIVRQSPTHTTADNTNWAGYLAQASQADDAETSIVQPKITCAAHETSSVGFWVGISDPYGQHTIAQDGTSAFCYNGTPGYYLWWEAYGRSASQGGGYPVPVLNTNSTGVNVAPAVCKQSPVFNGQNSVTLKQLAFLVKNRCTTPVAPGDHINLSISVGAGSYAAFFAYNYRTGFQLNTTQTFAGVQTGGAEWIAETQGAGLSNFGKVTFANCWTALGGAGTVYSISELSYIRLTLVYYTKVITVNVPHEMASPGDLTAPQAVSPGIGYQDGFTVTWKHK